MSSAQNSITPKMTTYGTIPTSSSSSPPINVEYISRAKERIKEGLGTRRPWREVLDLRSLSLPRSFGEAVSRVKANLAYFRMNYVMVALLILFLSLLWHPVSLIVFIAMMALWLFLYFLRDEPLRVFGRLVSDSVVMIVLLVVTVVVLLLTHATENILIALAVGVVVVLLHAVVRRTDDHVAVDEETGGLWRGPTSSSSS